jgi:hypothetical protein
MLLFFIARRVASLLDKKCRYGSLARRLTIGGRASAIQAWQSGSAEQQAHQLACTAFCTDPLTAAGSDALVFGTKGSV